MKYIVLSQTFQSFRGVLTRASNKSEKSTVQNRFEMFWWGIRTVVGKQGHPEMFLKYFCVWHSCRKLSVALC